MRKISAGYAAMLLASAPILSSGPLSSGPALAQPAGTVDQPAAAPAGVGPNLQVASVRMENGVRASKIIGSGVFNEQNVRVGDIDDLMMTRDDRVAVAVISVGGFLGIGSKLVAVPWKQLNRDQDGKIVLPGASKDSLTALPSFTYG